MVAPVDPRQGRRWRTFAQSIIRRDRGICWRCGGRGANQAGHVIPYAVRPDLAWDPNNVRAEHSTKRYAASLGYDCPGNQNEGARVRRPPPTARRRPW